MRHRSRSHAAQRHVALIACVATLALAGNLPAQLVSAVDLGSRAARLGAGEWQRQLVLSPFARFDRPNVSLDARWTVLGREGGPVTGEGGVTTTMYWPERAGFRLAAAAFADRATLDAEQSVARLGADVGLSYRFGFSGAWIGREISRDDRATPVPPAPRLSLGGWRQMGRAVLTVSVSSFGSHVSARARSSGSPLGQTPGPTPSPPSDTMANPGSAPPVVPDTSPTGQPPDSTADETHRGWNDAELALDWSVGRLALRGVVGSRFSTADVPNELWGNVQGIYAVGPEVALITSAGVRPSSFAYGVARARFLDFGVRIAPGALLHPRLPRGVRPVAAAFELEEASRGRRTIRVRVPGARTVEVSGDFTGWKPVALARAGRDRWEITLPLARGLHRLAIRVDGEAWRAPPGVSTVADEFQGTVGVIVVP